MNATRLWAVEHLRGIVLEALGECDAAVYLFGSHARGDVRHASDIDLAILPREELPSDFFALLAETIDQSMIPYEVDLVDLRTVAPAFREEVVRTGIKWRDWHYDSDNAEHPQHKPAKLMSDTDDDAHMRVTDEVQNVDAYFSADVETDGPIPGPFSMLSFAIVYAGSFDGERFQRPPNYERVFYQELKPISNQYQDEALRVNGLDRNRLLSEGKLPEHVMTEACQWVKSNSGNANPILVAYPLSFDWSWLYWYFIRFSAEGSPFGYSRCFDIKTALSVKGRIPVCRAGRARLDPSLGSNRAHSHHAIGDAIEQAEIFANIFEWRGVSG